MGKYILITHRQDTRSIEISNLKIKTLKFKTQHSNGTPQIKTHIYFLLLLHHHQSLDPTMLGSTTWILFLHYFLSLAKAKSLDRLHIFKSIHSLYYFHACLLQPTPFSRWALNLHRKTFPQRHCCGSMSVQSAIVHYRNMYVTTIKDSACVRVSILAKKLFSLKLCILFGPGWVSSSLPLNPSPAQSGMGPCQYQAAP